MIRIIDVDRPLFEFSSKTQWINKGRSWYENCGVHVRRTLTLDKAGRVCTIGADFERAKRESTYPITVYAIDPPIDAEQRRAMPAAKGGA